MGLTNNHRGGGQRESNLERYRIPAMPAIAAHHYVVNSGLMEQINESNSGGCCKSVLRIIIGDPFRP